MAALRPDYDDDPGRWTSRAAPQDVHELVAPELEGPVLDVGCGDGRLAALAAGRGIAWIGVDSSRSQLVPTLTVPSCWRTCGSCPSGMAHSTRRLTCGAIRP